MNYKVKVYTIFEIGQHKDTQGTPLQEDCIFPAQGTEKDSDSLFILCDGNGGRNVGDVASATVCDDMSRSILSHPDADTNFIDQMLQQAIDAAFDALDRKDTGTVKKMGTTMTFLKLHSHGATIAHMGDSRVYHIRQGRTAAETQILYRTQDHSLVNDLVRAGEMTEEQARHSRQKNIITRAMQPHMDRRPKAEIYHAIDVRPGDYFYMCSDGMLEQMSDEQIREIFSWNYDHGDDTRKVATLRELTRNNRDNHSAIIVHILQLEYRSYGATALKKNTKPENITTSSNIVDETEFDNGTALGDGTALDDGTVLDSVISANGSSVFSANPLPNGTILHGCYRIEKFLKSGGFGKTYMATDLRWNRKVAIKEFFLSHASLRTGDKKTNDSRQQEGVRVAKGKVQEGSPENT